MELYLRVVWQAVAFFPFAAALIALPFLIHHYRKYGSMTFARFFLCYSFVLYALCAYFLVILPLPSREEVAQMTGPGVQLVPFSFFRDLGTETDFRIGDPSTYLPALFSNFTLQFVFNIALLVPFGAYLRYFFRRGLWQTVALCFCASLFFELTQLSGLYGIYPRPYRLFDVDDLLCNTLGGLLGWALTGPLLPLLPDREAIDQKAYRKGERISFTRRSLSFLVDLVFVSLLGSLLDAAGLPFAFGAAYLLYFGLFQWACRGKSLGKRLTKLCVVNRDGSRVALWRCLLRYGLVTLFFTAYTGGASLLRAVPFASQMMGVFLAALWLCAGAFAFLLETALNRSSKTGRDYLYGRLSGTRLMSTVLRQPQPNFDEKG